MIVYVFGGFVFLYAVIDIFNSYKIHNELSEAIAELRRENDKLDIERQEMEARLNSRIREIERKMGDRT